MKWKKYKKKILIIALILLVYALILINVIPMNRGNIDFGVSSTFECYSLVSSHFIKEKGCWYKEPYKNFVWRLNKLWETEGGKCIPCHQVNTIFQNCVESLGMEKPKTKGGFCKNNPIYSFHVYSEVNGTSRDVYFDVPFGSVIYDSEMCEVK